MFNSLLKGLYSKLNSFKSDQNLINFVNQNVVSSKHVEYFLLPIFPYYVLKGGSCHNLSSN